MKLRCIHNSIRIRIKKSELQKLDNEGIITETISLDGLGAGFHVLQVNSYVGENPLDTFTTPGTPPFYEAPNPTGIIRYEENDRNILLNGVNYEKAARTFTYASNGRVSSGQYTRSETLNDTFSLAFTGEWVNVGLIHTTTGGYAEIFVDGASQEGS